MSVHRFITTLMLGILAACLAAPVHAETTHRLYDGVTLFINNADGGDFTLSLDVRDCNYRNTFPGEMFVRVYPPDGRPVVRELIPDDGIHSPAYQPPVAGWDHEYWYLATCYSRGLRPAFRWSTFSDPARLASMPARTFKYTIKGGQKGVYRVVLTGGPDLYVTARTSPELPYGVAGSPEWLHGHGDQMRKSYVYVPRGTELIHGLFLEMDEPKERSFTLSTLDGQTLMSGDSTEGLAQRSYAIEPDGDMDEQVLVLEVSEGAGDFLINLTMQIKGAGGKVRQSAKDRPPITMANFDEIQPLRGPQAVTAVISPDIETAKATQGGAIYHDGRLFWQMYQVRLYDWLKDKPESDFEYPEDLPEAPEFYAVGSHQSPIKGRPGWGDRLMHSYSLHKNEKVLNYCIRDAFYGARLIGHGDHVAIGPLANLAYEMGSYSYFYPREVWRILQQTDAPPEVKAELRDYAIQICDRIAMYRGMELVNGNSLASSVQSLRYLVEATDDPLNRQLYESFVDRFQHGGFGDRLGLGPRGGCQESFGYDFHYGSYVLRGWNAIRHDIKDPTFEAMYDRIMTFYSYIWSPEGNAPFNARTSNSKVAGGTYNSWHSNLDWRWKGHGGPDFTVDVADAHELFAARRRNYYAASYHGRLGPTWMGEGFHGLIGLGGGALCQVVVPGNGGGTVIGSSVNGSYGKGMDPSLWRGFHIHGIIGETMNHKPMIAASSEHANARLVDNTVSSSGEVRMSSVISHRSYTYGPASITVRASLEGSGADNAFSLWGGRPEYRGSVREAYEMIPYIDMPDIKGKKHPRANIISLLAADGSVIAPISTEPQICRAVLIDRHGFGARIEFAEDKRVFQGENRTIMVVLADTPTKVTEIAIEYRIIPYLGEAPQGAVGSVSGTGKPKVIRTLPAVADLDAVAPALAEQPEWQITLAKDKPGATLRIAFAGDMLALHASVTDPFRQRGARPWEGSDFEVFGAMPGSAIGQVHLQAAAGEHADKALAVVDMKALPTDRVQFRTTPTDTGYELVALIPQDLLKVDRSKERLTLEFQISIPQTAPAEGKKAKMAYATLFGSRFAYEDASRFARFAPLAPGDELPEDPAADEAAAPQAPAAPAEEEATDDEAAD